MLIKRQQLEGIVAGRITLAFRRWKRPTVRTGGTLHTALGLLAIEAVDPVREVDITERHARQAGFASRAELLKELRKRAEGRLYRIRLKSAGPDPRERLRTRAKLGKDDVLEIDRRLERLDRASRRGPWTMAMLALIAERPATRAADLAAEAGLARDRLKTDVRKLKALGLTESLERGYRLSPRGRAYLAATGRS